jgi:N-acetylneuraminic acid mutarotase
VSGSSSVDATGVYGTQGIAAAGNVPGARVGSVSWIDSAGDLWLFGGTESPASPVAHSFNDLWRYSPRSGLWTWVSGSSTVDATGVYGTQGVAAAGNVPGGREFSVSWIDSTGDLWLFGGVGILGFQNDLWRYSPSSGQWMWVSGSNTDGNPGVYGTQGIAAAGNVPGGRFGSVSWIDSAGNLLLFGGAGYDSRIAAPETDLNDLWRYSPASGQWTWVSGSSTGDAKGVYGTQGVAAAGNVPGARYASVSWIDSAGNLWLFGGGGYDSDGTLVDLNDLWVY